MNKDLIKFHGKVIKVALEEFNASCHGVEAERFVDRLFEEFKQCTPPENVETWLSRALRDKFLSVANAPIWVEDEPNWPFCNSEPMVFISQYEMPDNEVVNSKLDVDEIVYLFGARIPVEKGFEIKYELVSQLKGFGGQGIR